MGIGVLSVASCNFSYDWALQGGLAFFWKIFYKINDFCFTAQRLFRLECGLRCVSEYPRANLVKSLSQEVWANGTDNKY